MLANVNMGLIEPDVFDFGNAIGENGNSATDVTVDAFGMLSNRRGFVTEYCRTTRRT